MNKFVLLIAALFFISLGSNSQVLVVGWTFPGSMAGATEGIEANIGQEIYTMGGTSDIEFKNGLETKAAQVTEWDNGIDVKAWVVEITTSDFENLTISSIQQSGGNDPGPKDFKLQYSIQTDVWVDIVGGEISVENDWTTSAVENLALPTECEEQELLKLRWLMASNEASGAGGDVLETGKSKIDDILIHGELIDGINNPETLSSLSIYPNPTQGNVALVSDKNIENVQLISLTGQVVKSLNSNSPILNLNLSNLPKGTYFLLTKVKGNDIIEQSKLIVL